MIYFITGLLVALSFIVLIKKIEKKKYESLLIDGSITIGLLFLFSGSFIGLIVATIAGLILSIYFYIFDPKWIKELFNEIDNNNFILKDYNEK